MRMKELWIMVLEAVFFVFVFPVLFLTSKASFVFILWFSLCVCVHHHGTFSGSKYIKFDVLETLRCALDFTQKVSVHVTKHLHVIGNYDTEFGEGYSEFITIALWLCCHANTQWLWSAFAHCLKFECTVVISRVFGNKLCWLCSSCYSLCSTLTALRGALLSLWKHKGSFVQSLVITLITTTKSWASF